MRFNQNSSIIYLDFSKVCDMFSSQSIFAKPKKLKRNYDFYTILFKVDSIVNANVQNDKLQL